MAAKEWIVPLGLGVAAALAAALLLPPHAPAPSTPSPRVVDFADGIVLRPAPDAPAGRMSLLHEQEGRLTIVNGTYRDGGFTTAGSCEAAPCPSTMVLWPGPTSRIGGPTFGAGHDTVQATILVFLRDGHLTLANTQNTTRYATRGLTLLPM